MFDSYESQGYEVKGPVPKKRLIERKRRLPEDNKLRDTKTGMMGL